MRIGNLAGLRPANYTPTLLNQYSSYTVPEVFDVLGSAPPGASVAVNGGATYRKGDFWQAQAGGNNATGAVAVAVNVQSVSNTVTLTSNGVVFLPRSSVTNAYDADGNLTTNGQFSFAWDAENRLASFTPLPGTPTNQWQAGRLAYDYAGRRISKAVSNYVASVWQLAFDHRYVYDGWNLVAVLDANGTLLLSFTWGSDLSGTAQGAGGVGGLISMTVHSGPLAGTYFYVFDGNGNVVALVNAVDGSVAAQYEYGPFGELLRCTGPLAALNPFRFSTKFQDDETGVLYYGYRYYDPATGRWLGRDAIEESGGLNLYGFAWNDTVNAVDAFGLALYAFDGTGNTYVQQTHVGMLHSIYRGKAEYEVGVGTETRGIFDNTAVGGLTGAGGKDRVESMYRKFLANYAAGDKEIDIIGFSRGGALARHFANVLYDRGYAPLRTISGHGRNVTIRKKECDVTIRFVGLFDTVGSFGKPGNQVNLGYKLGLPPNVKTARQAIAKDEKRLLFPVTKLNQPGPGQSFQESVFPGDHSDIGGGHGEKQNLLAEAPLTYIWSEGRKVGVPWGDLPKRNLISSRTPHDMRASFSGLGDVLFATPVERVRSWFNDDRK